MRRASWCLALLAVAFAAGGCEANRKVVLSGFGVELSYEETHPNPEQRDQGDGANQDPEAP